MKKWLCLAGTLFIAVLFLSPLQGCLKDSCRTTYQLRIPVYKTLTEVRAAMQSAPAEPLRFIGKMTLFGHYIFLNEKGRGIHVIDNSNPASPKNESFIPVAGNIDMSIRGNYLYADSYSDVVVLNISDPAHIKAVRFMDNLMQEKNVYWSASSSSTDSVNVVVDYKIKDTTVECAMANKSAGCSSCSAGSQSSSGFYSAASQTGVNGSMASFAVIDHFLYAVSAQRLYSINLTDGANPVLAATTAIGGGIETVYPFQNKLFIGGNSGMLIYDVSNPARPAYTSSFSHARVCDPVITDGRYAYVTLRSTANFCGGAINELNVVDVNNLAAPALKKTYNLTNPFGLAKDGTTLFICDGTAGLKVYDASQPENLQLIKQFTGPETYDVVALNGTATLVAKDGLYQYDYHNPAAVKLLSKLTLSK